MEDNYTEDQQKVYVNPYRENLLSTTKKEAHQFEGQYFSTDPIKDGNQELIIRLVSGKDILNIIKFAMMGLEFDESSGKYIEISKPMINDDAVSEIISMLHPFINQNTTMSNLDDEYIRKVMPTIHMSINRVLYVNHEKYGISKDKYPILTRSIAVMVKAALSRAVDKTTLKFLKSTESHQYVHSSHEQREPKGGGILSKIGLGRG